MISFLLISLLPIATSNAATKAQLSKPLRAGRIASVGANTILNGVTAPKASEGIEGDFYINTKAMLFYGPKTKTSWPSPISIRGPKGQVGPNGSNGTDAKPGAHVIAAGAQGLTGATGLREFKVWPDRLVLKEKPVPLEPRGQVVHLDQLEPQGHRVRKVPLDRKVLMGTLGRMARSDRQVRLVQSAQLVQLVQLAQLEPQGHRVRKVPLDRKVPMGTLGRMARSVRQVRPVQSALQGRPMLFMAR
jgi:hypothetical protein